MNDPVNRTYMFIPFLNGALRKFVFPILWMIMRSLYIEANIFKGLLTLLLSLFIAWSVSANTYYVSKSGNDSNAGNLRYPWLTLTKASNTLVAGDTVLIRAGLYNEALWPVNSGSVNAHV